MKSVEFDVIEKYLNQFGGGDVILSNKYYDMGLAVVYFNNPGKKNAMSGQMMVKLRHIVIKLEAWNEGKAVLLCGLGGNFCSGGDLDFAKASGTEKEALYMCNWMQDTLKRLHNLPLISVCLIQGPTLGGGAEITIFCDFIVAADNARFGFVHGKMAIITAWGGTTRLVQKVGGERALKLLLTSEILNAQKCVENGIAECIFPAENCFEQTIEWLGQRIQHNSNVVRSFKRVVVNAMESNFDDSLEFEKALFKKTWGSPANREALNKNIKHIRTNSKI